MVSYEISIGMLLMPIVLYTGSLNILDIGLKQSNMGIGFILPFFPLFMLFFISSLAETNRPPFDLPEAELCLGFIKDHYMLKYSIIQSARNLIKFLQRIYMIKINWFIFYLKINSIFKKWRFIFFFISFFIFLCFQFTNITNNKISSSSLLPFVSLPNPVKIYKDLSNIKIITKISDENIDKSGIYGFYI